jgi:ABC-2 type transport system permease protein
VWVALGGVAMYGMAFGIASEMDEFPGGREALAASVTASAEAMRLLRWPAERLDTLGGYLTFHNVILINFMFAIYGAVQGSRAVRGAEESHTLEEVLAAGASRAAVVRDRAVGFAVTAFAISLGIGLATAAGLAGAGEPDLAGSLITMGTVGLVGMVGFALGLLVSQVTASARTAAGASGAVLTALYLATNMGDELGPLAGIQFVSPFHYANASRALVPGHGLDLPATAALVAMTIGLLALAAWAFARRDYAAPLWSRPAPPPATSVKVPTVMLGSVWTAALRRGRAGVAIWAVGAAIGTALMAALQPAVMEVWSAFDFIGALTGGGPGVGAETTYWSYSSDIVMPVIAAFAIAQASGWVADLAQGRVEMLLAGPVSWSRLVLERLLALVVGVVTMTVLALASLAVGGMAVGGTLDAAGLGRAAVGCVLMGAALGGAAAVVVAWVRRGAAVTVLAIVVGGSYLVSLFVPMFGWPEWLNRLSVFWAIGHPYLAWPTAGGLATLLILAVPGALVAAAIAERTPKVA